MCPVRQDCSRLEDLVLYVKFTQHLSRVSTATRIQEVLLLGQPDLHAKVPKRQAEPHGCVVLLWQRRVEWLELQSYAQIISSFAQTDPAMISVRRSQSPTGFGEMKLSVHSALLGFCGQMKAEWRPESSSEQKGLCYQLNSSLCPHTRTIPSDPPVSISPSKPGAAHIHVTTGECSCARPEASLPCLIASSSLFDKLLIVLARPSSPGGTCTGKTM